MWYLSIITAEVPISVFRGLAMIRSFRVIWVYFGWSCSLSGRTSSRIWISSAGRPGKILQFALGILRDVQDRCRKLLESFIVWVILFCDSHLLRSSKDGKWSYSVCLGPTCQSLRPDRYRPQSWMRQDHRSCDHVNQILLDNKSCNVTQVQKRK
jgi:hypothetical protein